MQFSWLYAALILLPGMGALLSAYIYRKKHGRKLMTCPLKLDCNAVIHSSYASFFGIPVEVIGVFYYLFIALSYLAVLFWQPLATSVLGLILLSVSALAFLFSVYLTFIQIFAIRQLCSLCLTSALISGTILWLSLIATQIDFVAVLVQYQPIILMLHVLGVTLGVGGATLSDIFFFRFIKDLRISHEESDVLRTISQVIWFALGLLVLSGLGLLLSDYNNLMLSSAFLAKVGMVLVLILNGLVLHYLVSPQLVRISFGIRHIHEAGELHRLRKLAYALAAVSIITWYAIFFLDLLPTVPSSAFTIFAVYAAVVLAGVGISQVIDLKNSKK